MPSTKPFHPSVAILIGLGLWLGGAAANGQVARSAPASSEPVAAKLRFDDLIQSGQAAIGVNPQSALRTADQAQHLIPQLEVNARRIAAARVAALRAFSYVASNRGRDAVAVLQPVLANEASLRSDPKLLGDIYRSLAMGRYHSGDTEGALRGLQQAYALYRAIGDRQDESRALQNIGTTYLLARDFEQALHYYDQADAAFRGDPLSRTSMLNNRGITLRELNRLDQAEQAFSEGAALAHQMGYPLLESKTLANLAQAQLAQRKLDAAEATLQRAFALSSNGSPDVAPLLYNAAADLALHRGQPDRAAQLINRAFAAAGALKGGLLDRELEQTAYQVFKAKGDRPQALAHLERFKELDDQARALAASAQAALMSARFDFANQNARIAQLRQSEAEQEATIQRNRNVFQRRLLGAGTLILVLLLIGFFSIRRSRNQVRAANAELTDTNTELEKALAARTEFLATTSHEIRTPLNGILGMTQVLLADRALPADVKGKIELVQGAGETMKALVDDILDVAKITNGEVVIHRAEMDLQRLLRDAAQVWEAQAMTKGVAIELDLDAAPERIVEDEVRLRQIVFNLMANAVKFTDRGAVRLVARFEADGEDAGEQGHLTIAISDTGIGIPPDRLEEIFESFRQIDGGTTRRHGGTGLGLAICRNLARIMGGDVAVSSILGTGSTFTIALPCTAVPRRAPVRAAASLAESRVLLLETNPLQRAMIGAVMTPHVARLVPAGDPEEARLLLESEAVELAVADGGVFALDIAAAAAFAAAAQAKGVGTVLLWPTPGDDVLQAAEQAGILRIVAKPVSAQDLVAALKDIYMTDASPKEIAA